MLRLLLFSIVCCASLGNSRALAQSLPGELEYESVENNHVHLLEHSPESQHPTIGSEAAPVTFEFFLTVGNNRSASAHRTLLKLAHRHPKRLRIIYRLTDTSERSSKLAQIFAHEAFKQGRFFDFIQAFYLKRRGPSASKDYPLVAAQAGVDYTRVQEAHESTRHDQFLRSNYFYWRRWHVPAVPGLLINGYRSSRVGKLEALEALYDQAYDESMTALASGVAPSNLQSYLRRKHLRHEDRALKVSGTIDPVPGELAPQSPLNIRMNELLKGEYSQGPEDAKVTLIFVCHLQSSNCRSMSRSLRTLRRAYDKEVKLIVHPLFDSELPHQDKAQLMHEAASCADEQGAFWEYYRLAFERQRRINFDQGFAVDLASSPLLDLDVEDFETCVESGRHAARVREQVKLVRKAGVTHVPALAVAGLLYSGWLNFDKLRVLVDKELAPGLLEAGVGY